MILKPLELKQIWFAKSIDRVHWLLSSLTGAHVLDSLSDSEVGVGDVGSLEHIAPEAGELMAVVDLDDVELLYDARVKAHLLLLEAREHSLSEVNSEAIVEFDLLIEVSLILLQLALD